MLNPVDKGTLLKFISPDGYVFDLSTSQFDQFTLESVGLELCRHYGLSKGKSLQKFIAETSEDKAIKLFADLLHYYELNLFDRAGDDYKKDFFKCKQIVENCLQGKELVTNPAVKRVNRDYIQDIAKRACDDIEERNFDSAFTKSRTLLEEVFFYAVEKCNQKPDDSGNISKLYNQVKSLYKMHQSPEIDNRVNSLLSGLEKIVMSISEMRNKNSDAHAAGDKRINVKAHHARLYVNSAITVADFILSVVENKCSFD